MNYRRPLTVLAVTAAAFAACGVAHASTVVGGPVGGSPGYYDYGPVVSQHGDTQDLFWCGDSPSHGTDGIKHEQYSLTGGAHVTVPTHFVLDETPGSWDWQYTCNPDIVQGNFTNPLGDGRNFTEAMYYVGYGTQAVADNQIGVAFGTGPDYWVKYPNPVITAPSSNGQFYGAGQPDVSYVNGVETMIYAYTEGGVGNGGGGGAEVHYMVTSTDGVTFTAPVKVSAAGLPSPVPSSGGASYNASDGRWYLAFDDDPTRPTSTTGDVVERGQPGVTLYSIDDPVNGTWQQLDTIDTVTTGYESNFIAGLLTNPDGTVFTPGLPTIELYLASSTPRPAYNAVGAALGTSGAFNNWDIYWDAWTPGNPWRTLQRVDHSGGYHEVTTGYWDTSYYHLENITLGKLAEAPTGDANVPLYLCKLGNSDYFNTTRSDCSGRYKLGLDGYLYATAAADRNAVYECWVTSTGDFMSLDPNCEGQHIGGLLGYTQK